MKYLVYLFCAFECGVATGNDNWTAVFAWLVAFAFAARYYATKPTLQ